MLRLEATGDKHPKTFTLYTDDADGELARLHEIVVDEVGADEDDPIRAWLAGHTAEQFAEGVVVPAEQVGEFEDILESDWPDAAAVVERERNAALDEMERAED